MRLIHEVLDPAGYAQAVEQYQRGTDAQKNAAGDALVRSARGLILLAIKDRPNCMASFDDHQRDSVIDDTLLEVLTMAKKYDPEKGVTFSQWLSSTSAPWRTALAAHITSQTAGPYLRRAERDVLRVAHGVIKQFRTENESDPTARELDVLMEAAVNDFAISKGKTLEQARQDNVRSGFSRAMASVHQLLTAEQYTTFLDEENNEIAEIPHLTDSNIQAVVDQTELADLVSLAGNVNNKEAAANRLAAPHAQWIFLTPAAALTYAI